MQVAGLWYILAITLGMAVVVSLMQQLVYNKELHQKIANTVTGTRSESRRAAAAGAAAAAATAVDGADCVAELTMAGEGVSKHKPASPAAVPAVEGGGDQPRPRQPAALKLEQTAVQALA